MPRTPASARVVSVTVEGATDSIGPGTGYPIETFVPLPPDLWAARTPLVASEDMQADQLTERNAYEWRIPYRTGHRSGSGGRAQSPAAALRGPRS